MIEIIEFIFLKPFHENIIFSLAIVLVFIGAFVSNLLQHQNFYNKIIKKVHSKILDDFEEPKPFTAVPGILMGIGIIGTFYLIYSSLSHFNIDEIKEVSKIITHSIAPAFSVSALGIFSSILYVILEKTLIVNPYRKKFNKLHIDKHVKSYADITLEHLELSQKLLKTTQEQTEALSGLNQFSTSLKEASEGMTKFAHIAETLEQTLNPQVLGNVIAQAVNSEMKPILDKVQSVSENVDINSQKITDFLEVELKNEIIIPLKISVDNTSESIRSIEQALNKTSQAMIETNKGFDKLNQSLAQLENLQENFVSKLDNVLEKQEEQFDKTTKTIINTYSTLTNTVNTQIDRFNRNSQEITDSFSGLSKEMQEFLIGYKQDYKELLQNQEQAIKETSQKAIEILDTSGAMASKTITDAADKLQSTLDGVDEALVKTSQSIKNELEKFKDSYTDSLEEYLNSQEEILNNIFKEQTERLSQVVNDFKDTLEEDVSQRKQLNEELNKLIKTTDGFVASTKAMLSTAFDEQKTQLEEFMETNRIMQSQLRHIVENATAINDNGNILIKELIETTANLQKQFNDNQIEILKKYQIEVDNHLKEILSYMAAIIEASHLDNGK